MGGHKTNESLRTYDIQILSSYGALLLSFNGKKQILSIWKTNIYIYYYFKYQVD